MNAIIYCRVSSRDQVEGTSLESQETACREYARKHQFSVSQVFIEEGESAKFADRTQLLRLIDHCKVKSNAVAVLIVWKLDRFARNVEDHFAIKAALRKYGVNVVSVTEPIQADANGKLMETILAGFAQFDNDVRALRTVQGMQQKLKEGIYPWNPPLGYLPPKIGKKTKPDRPDPQTFEPLCHAWQLAKTGAYTKMDIVRLLRSRGIRGYRGNLLCAQTIDQILRNPFYAGVLRDPWSGAEYQGRHVPMVTREEFAQVQSALSPRSNSRFHARMHPAFPLRGLARCPSCQRYLTGSYAQGRHKRYPYYQCFRRDCPTRTKNYPLSLVHEEFSQFLMSSSMPAHLFFPLLNDFNALVAETSSHRREAGEARGLERERLDRQFAELVTMRAGRLITDDEFVLQRDRIRKQTLELEAIQARETDRALTPTEAEQIVAGFADLNTAWQESPLTQQRGLSELLFPVGYVFQRIRTAETGLLISIFGTSDDQKSNVVPLVRENLNSILSELRRFVELLAGARGSQKQAA